MKLQMNKERLLLHKYLLRWQFLLKLASICWFHYSLHDSAYLKTIYINRASGYMPNSLAKMVKDLLAMQKTQVHPWVQRTPWRREWQSTPVFLPGEFHGQRSLAGDSPWGHKESETTEWQRYTWGSEIW